MSGMHIFYRIKGPSSKIFISITLSLYQEFGANCKNGLLKAKQNMTKTFHEFVKFGHMIDKQCVLAIFRQLGPV